MAKNPYLPLFTDAYLADTRHLTREEHGAYLLLLMEAWRRPSCSLPDDDTLLARLVLATPEEWQRLKPVVMAFWKLDKRRREFVQKRLLAERKFVADRSQKQRDRVAKRWKKTENEDTAVIPDEYRSDTPTPTPTPTLKEDTTTTTTTRAGAEIVALPGGKDGGIEAATDAVIDLVAHRSPGQIMPASWCNPAARILIAKWFTDLDLTPGEVLQVAEAQCARHGKPPGKPEWWNGPMQAFAAAKAAPPLEAPAPQPRQPYASRYAQPEPPNVLAKLRARIAEEEARQ